MSNLNSSKKPIFSVNVDGLQSTLAENIIEIWQKKLHQEFSITQIFKPILIEIAIKITKHIIWALLRPEISKSTLSDTLNKIEAISSVNLDHCYLDHILIELNLLRDEIIHQLQQVIFLSKENINLISKFFDEQSLILSNQVFSLKLLTRDPIIQSLALDNAELYYFNHACFIINNGEPLTKIIPSTIALTSEFNSYSKKQILPNYRHRVTILSHFSKILLHSIDYKNTLMNIAQILLFFIADGCIIDISTDEKTLRREIIAHRDQTKAPLIAELWHSHNRTDSIYDDLPPYELRARQSCLVPEITEEHPAATAICTRYKQILQDLGSKSYMALTLFYQNKFLGIITLVSCIPGKCYSVTDFQFAEELCSRAALAIHNAILHRTTEISVRTREDLISIVSHDLKNPLTAIELTTDLMSRFLAAKPISNEIIEKNLKSFISGILKPTQVMKSLVSDLLDLSKLDAGQLVINRKKIPLLPLIKDAADFFSTLLAEQSISLIYSINDDVPIFCDPQRFSQILLNLVSNAIKFTPRGGSIHIYSEKTSDLTWIHVQDTGIGISKEHLPYIFDRFWQTQRSNRNGTGLGLSIVKAMVEAHGGQVKVQSEPNQGSKFSFGIPNEC